MKIMEGRQSELQFTLDGLNASEMPLVNLYGQTYGVAGYTDDVGIYYFIPKIAHFFGISIDQAINGFFGFLLLFGALIAISSFWTTFKPFSSRLIALIGTSLLTLAFFRYSDVYIAFFFAVASIIPVLILYNQKPHLLNKTAPIVFAFSGIIIGYSNLIRSHAGTGALLFALLWIVCNERASIKQKALYISLLVFSIALPYLHFNTLESNRDQFLTKVIPAYEKVSVRHPKWHAIYLGLGYLKNNYGIEWSDRIAWEKAVSINPNVKSCSEEYEQILKDEFFSIAKKDPGFIIKTIVLKTAKMLYRVVFFANIGLFFLFYVKPPLRRLIPFIVSAFFYALPGILVMPINVYVSGMAAIVTFFGLYMIGLGIEKRGLIKSEFATRSA